MLKDLYTKYKVFVNGIIFSVMPFISFILMEFYEHNPFIEIRPVAFLFNILLFELLAWIVYVFTGRMKWAVRFILIAAMIFGMINHYVMLFRSTPFVPWDIFSIKTASSVAGNYDFMPTARVIIVTVIYIVLVVLAHFMNYRMEMKIKLRLIPGAIITVVLCLFVSALQNEDFQTDNYLYPFLFTPAYMTKVNGMAVTFAMDMAYIAVDKPAGYSEENARQILDEYKNDDNGQKEDASEESDTNNNEKMPNIIVIMDEAFSDLSVLGNFETNKDYMPFVHSLQNGADNTITGNLNVSVCGGNTADTEFEFLTGNTMAFLPAGSIPYQQYIKDTTPSLASYLKGLGYETYAQHPYNASGWNRETVYPLLGFENMAFAPDYLSRDVIRNYISDKTSFEKIIETYENKPEDKPAFIFNVTMQNHGGYTDTYWNFTNTINAKGLGNDALNQYLSLIKLTDSDLSSLISYFKEQDEKTIIVFFGDHQPNYTVASSVLAENGMDYSNLSTEETYLRYQVPYVVWANYDIQEAQNQDMSVNYLAANVLKTAGVPTSDYQNFLLELQKDYPIISAIRTEDVKADTDEEMLKKYKILQYYRLFDQKGDN